MDKAYELIAETMKLFGNSAYGKCITNKENFVSTTYANEDNISKKSNSPHFKDLESIWPKISSDINKARRINGFTSANWCCRLSPS